MNRKFDAFARTAMACSGIVLALLASFFLANDAGAAEPDQSFSKFLLPQSWTRDIETPSLSLGQKGKFDDQHIFAPHVVYMDGEFWMYYCGSQRCIDAGTYKGVAKPSPEKSDQRLFKLGLAKSKDGIHSTRVSEDPIFSFGDDIHSIVTAAILKNPDGSVCRENGQLRMYFAAVDFPGGTYKHDLYQTTSPDGIHWAKPTLVMENAYAPCVIKEGGKYRMWYTWINKHPWHTNHAESPDGTHWTISEKPCIVMDQKWEVKDQVYPMVIKVNDVYIMLYGCYWADDKHTALGFAVSKDGLTWTKHLENPVFRPEPKHDWESNFTTSHTLMRLPDGTFRLWYAGRRQPPWSNLYFAIGTAHWGGPARANPPAADRNLDRAKADIAALDIALDLFELDCQRFPTTVEGLSALVKRPNGLTNWKGPYIKSVPKDPWGAFYVYRWPGKEDPRGFNLFSLGPDSQEGTEDDIGNASTRKP